MAAVLTALARELRRFAGAVDRPHRPAMAVIGGLAVSVRTEPRFTRDADLAIATANDGESEALVLSLQQRGYRVLAVLEHENGRMSTVRLLPPGGSEDGVVVDLLFASSGIEPELVAEAEPIEVLPGVVLPVARVGHLIALKLLSVDDRRPKDAQDLLALIVEASPDEVARCVKANGLITERGYSRGRDLDGALAALLARAGLS